MKILSYRFNGRASPAKILISINDRGITLIDLPGCSEPIIVLNGFPIEIDISGDGPGPDVAISLEVNRK